MPPAPSRVTVILARLLLASGRWVTLSELVELAWQDDPPLTAVNQIHRHVGELRRLLEGDLPPRATGAFVEGTAGAYRISLVTSECEIRSYFSLLAAAERAEARGAEETVVLETYRQALSLASEPPFQGLPDRVLELPSFATLNRSRIATAVKTATLTLAAGELPDEQLLAIVEKMAREDAASETLHARLIELFHKAGRPSDALAHFESIRELIAEQFGVDPGPELRAAHHAVLTDIEAPFSSTVYARHPAWSNLPGELSGFVDRADVFDFDEANDAASSIVVISGMAGIGKTTYAVNWAHRNVDRFRDGHIYVNMRGFDPNGQVLAAVDGVNHLLDQLGVDVSQAPRGEAARSALLRSELASKQLLIVIDNARDAEHVRPLLPGNGGCFVIVTSRDQMPGLVVREGARLSTLGRWSAADATALITQRVGRRRVAADEESVASIVASCGGLPLALTIAAARSAMSPDTPMAAIAADLASADRVFSTLRTGDEIDDVQLAFRWSFMSLSSDAATIFTSSGAHPGLEMSSRTLAGAAAMPTVRAERALAELVDLSVLEPASDQRYTVHDLLKTYALQLLGSGREVVESRLISHYAHALLAAYAAWPQRVGIAPSPQPKPNVTAPYHFGSPDETINWYREEMDAITPLTDLALQTNPVDGISMVLNLRPIVPEVHHGNEYLPQAIRALAAARPFADSATLAELERWVGAVYGQHPTPNFSLSDKHLLAALNIHQTNRDWVGVSNTYRNLSMTTRLREDTSAGIRYAELSVKAAQKSGQALVESNASMMLLAALAAAGRLDAVVDLAPLVAHHTQEHFPMRANLPYEILGWAEFRLAHWQGAFTAAKTALALTREDSPRMFPNLAVVADAGARLGRTDEAMNALHQLEQLLETGRPIFRNNYPLEEAAIDARITTIKSLLNATNVDN